ncbi:hypothetical protein [Iodidimonas sp. SYSU 1G8]|uniref:hypothetical protein n=1 Tax=Iodidimonas sp. SYSU 1G8 TaxID=3133967 RepID=UPI0031FE5A57
MPKSNKVYDMRTVGLKPIDLNSMTPAEAGPVIEALMGAALNPLDKDGRPLPDLEELVADPGARLPYRQTTPMLPDGSVMWEHWPRTGDPVETIYAYDEEPGGSTAVPGRPGLNKFGYQPAPGDVEGVARALYAEAGGQQRAWPALGWSIINRVNPGAKQRSTLQAVLKEPRQFDRHGTGRWLHNPATMAPADLAAWKAAQEMARGVLSGDVPDPTRGGTYFYSGDPGAPPHGAEGFFGRSVQSGRLAPVLSVDGFTFLKDMYP